MNSKSMENPELYGRLSDFISKSNEPLVELFARFYLLEMVQFIEFDKNDDGRIDKDAVFAHSSSLIRVGREILEQKIMNEFIARFLSGIIFTLVNLIGNNIQFNYE